MKDKMKHTAKDSVFAMLCRDEKYLLELYRCLHPEDESITAEDLEILSLETALVSSYYNDLSLTARTTIIILVEAQSKFSLNISLRMLLYLAEALDQYVKQNGINLHSKKPAVIPRPELYVIYTGSGEVPPVVRLSDLYADTLKDPEERAKQREEFREKFGWADLEIRVLRRNGKHDLVDQYVRFCEICNETRKTHGTSVEAVKEIIRRCVEEGVLVEFLLSRRMEVESSMKHLFDEETARRFYEEELRKKAAEEAAEKAAEEATEKATERGIRALIAMVKKLSQSKDVAIQGLIEQFNLLPQNAAEKVALYW